MTTRVAAIDIGTNSVLLLIADGAGSAATHGSAGSQPTALLERATITRLGAGVDRTRELDPASVERTLLCLRDYAERIRESGATRIAVVGTSALQDAHGGASFCDEVEHLLGTRPEVLSGDREARLSFAGAAAGLPVTGDALVCDVGGGSTELIHGFRAPGESAGEVAIRAAISLDIGGVRLFERHIRADPPSQAELEAARATIRKALKSAFSPPSGATFIGVAGTVTTLAAIALGLETYDAAKVHGSRLALAQLSGQIQHLASLTVEQRKQIAALEPARADVIVTGALIVEEAMRWARSAELVVSDRGVRWGLVQELLMAPDASAI